MNSIAFKGAAMALAIGVMPVAALAQDTAPPVAPAATEDWTPFSRSGTRAYLADLTSLTTGDPVSVRLARAPLAALAGDYSYTVDDYQFQCAAEQVRLVATTEYGPDGVQTDRFTEEAAWEDIPANSLDAYLKGVACDGARAEARTWPSIKAFIDAGRP